MTSKTQLALVGAAVALIVTGCSRGGASRLDTTPAAFTTEPPTTAAEVTTTTMAPVPTTLAPRPSTTTTAPAPVRAVIVTTTTSEPRCSTAPDCGTTSADAIGYRAPNGSCVVADAATAADYTADDGVTPWGLTPDPSCG